MKISKLLFFHLLHNLKHTHTFVSWLHNFCRCWVYQDSHISHKLEIQVALLSFRYLPLFNSLSIKVFSYTAIFPLQNVTKMKGKIPLISNERENSTNFSPSSWWTINNKFLINKIPFLKEGYYYTPLTLFMRAKERERC